jgi:beta-xylosidase
MGTVEFSCDLLQQGTTLLHCWERTFSDIFEENYFPSVPFHGGFGLLNLHGIAKPTYRALPNICTRPRA